MGRTVELNGGVNRIDGPIEVLDVHGGVVNISGRVGACNHFGGVINGAIGKPKVEESARGQFLGRQLPTKPSPGSHGSNWDDYRPTKAECEAVYKNFKVWLECEEDLEPINL